MKYKFDKWRKLLEGVTLKDLNLLLWLSQLGLSVAVPPAGFLWLSAWLRDRFGWGQWIVWAALGLGLYCAVTGFISSLRTLSRFAKEEKTQNTIRFCRHD